MCGGLETNGISDLTFLVAESFLAIAAILTCVFIGKLAADKSAEIITGVVRGIPVSPGTREALLRNIWLPMHGFNIALPAFLTLAQLEMANHVTDANLKALAYFFAFVGAIGVATTLIPLPVVLFAHRAKVRRDKQR
jgi:hypothetical protein